MWTNATIWTTDLEIMSFLVFAVGIVNTGWPRPLARSRTSGNHCVLVSENVSFEQSFSKNRDLCQRAIRCTSTWRSCIRIFQSTRKRYCKFPKHDLQKIFLHFANSDFCICKIRKLTFANTWSHPFQSLKTIGCNFWCRVFAKSQKTTMKDHAVMETSLLVCFCLPFTSESHTCHKLDKRSDEVRLRLSHRGANRPQTHTSVN